MGSSVVLLLLGNFFSWVGLVGRDVERFAHRARALPVLILPW